MSRRTLFQGWLVGAAALLLVGCGDAGPTPVAAGAYKTLSGGLKYAVLREGTGLESRPGVRLRVHYTGWLESSGKKFDSSLDSGQPLDFILDRQEVVPGWDLGLKGMKVGEKRRLIIPPAMGYGAGGAPPTIPPNATLLFDVELLSLG